MQVIRTFSFILDFDLFAQLSGMALRLRLLAF